MDAARLDELIAREEIRQALARFCRGIDRIDDALVCSIWHPGSRASYDGFFEGTGEELALMANAAHRRHVSHTHLLTNCVIEVAGERAASETCLTASLLREADGGHLVQTIHSRYLDRWSRRDGRWAVETRRVVQTFAYEQPVEAAVVGQAMRSADDPSYDLFRELEAA